MNQARFSEKRHEISDRLRDPTAFLQAVDFFEYWGASSLKDADGRGLSDFIEHAHVIGSARSAIHCALYVEPLLPLNNDLNGDGDTGHIPHVFSHYNHIGYPNIDAILEEYRDQLMCVIQQEKTHASTVRTWVDQVYNLGPRPYYSAIPLKELKTELCASDNAIGLGEDNHRMPFSTEANAQSLALKLVDPENGSNVRLHGLRPDDHYTIHGALYDMRARYLATEIFTLTQLGVRVFVPAEEAVRMKNEQSGVHWKHVDAITDAISELELLREAHIQYGVVWDQYNYRSEQQPNSLSSQLTKSSSIVLPPLPDTSA